MTGYAVWGWGGPEKEPRHSDLEQLAPLVADVAGFPAQPPERAAPIRELPTDRVSAQLPASLARLARADPMDRARHGIGRSYRDVVRGIRGELDAVPDCVLRPGSAADVAAILEWCGSHEVAVVPFSGGTSVVGGVEPAVGDRFARVMSVDLSRLSGVREVDPVSRSARVGAGTTGPALEKALRAHELTARFFPQSFERSTVGGWLATRAAGHFSTRLTHIDDLVESIQAVTPAGLWESRRLPASGAGPSPDRLLLGSEGSLGILTEAWLRVQPRPIERAGTTLAAPDMTTGAAAVRALLHDGLLPATCRLIDAAESAINGVLSTGEATLVLGFESTGAPVTDQMARAAELCRDAGLRIVDRSPSSTTDGGVDAWRSSFLRAPYLREHLVLLGVLVETFETVTTWDRLDQLIARVTEVTEAALREVCGGGRVTCRLTHVYPDGAAPYFTVLAPARRGSELAQWAQVKSAASEAILGAGGSITHHHAVGRDHRPWYDVQRPDPFALALRAAKAALDPAGVLNPGVLVG